jgi:hypothetical protein
MKSFKLFLFIIVVSANQGDAHKIACNNICPRIVLDMKETIHEGIVNFFKMENPPADGICLQGSKYIYDGKYFGFPGRKGCACFVTVKSAYQEGSSMSCLRSWK